MEMGPIIIPKMKMGINLQVLLKMESRMENVSIISLRQPTIKPIGRKENV